MNDTVLLIGMTLIMAASISAYLRSRYWAKRSESAAVKAEKYAERIRELRDAENIRIIKGHGR